MHTHGPPRRQGDRAPRRIRRRRGFVDDGHFFDLLAEDVIFEYVISVPGYPRLVEGRRAVADLYRDYGRNIVLRSADELAAHRDREVWSRST